MNMKKNLNHILYHVAVVGLSAALAFALPEIITYIARKVLLYWSYVENQELVLLSTELTAAILLIVLINVAVRGWGMQRRSRMTKAAGLFDVVPPKSILARRRLEKLKQDQGAGRNVMMVSSTGYRTFTDPAGDMHQVLRNCREAKIMLLDPLKDGVTARAKSIADPEVSPESMREQIVRSIDFLKSLKSQQKNIRLKLYRDVPLLKLSIIGDYLSLQHYPAGINVRQLPEYVLRHDKDGNLFGLFYQYFVMRWLDPAIPEYDLETDELVYRDKSGREQSREAFNEVVMEY